MQSSHPIQEHNHLYIKSLQLLVRLESCKHVLICEEVRRVDALKRSIGCLGDLPKKVGAEPTLQKAIITYRSGCNSRTMEEITYGSGLGSREMGKLQDLLG